MQKVDNLACSKCGYDLTGLDRLGVCPECGQPYDAQRSVGVDDTNHPQRRLDRLLKRVWTLSLIVAMLVVIACSGTCALFVPKPRTAIAIGGFVLLVLILATIISYLSQKEEY